MRASTTLLQQLIREGFIKPIVEGRGGQELRDFFRRLDGTFILLDIDGADGGRWLYKVDAADQAISIQERDLQEVESEAYQAKHFILALPDWVIYDVLLGDMTLEEASDYAAWGGSLTAHPVWVYLEIAHLLELFENLLDRKALVRLVRGRRPSRK